MAGLPSLLTTLLLSAERERRVPVLQCVEDAAAMLPSNFVAIATEALHCMNAFARARLTTAQQVRAAWVRVRVRAKAKVREYSERAEYSKEGREYSERAHPSTPEHTRAFSLMRVCGVGVG